MKKTFDRAVAFTLKWEGGYSYDVDDPGGETNFGISKRSYPQLDVKNLTLQDAKDIYFNDYWLLTGCNELDFPLDFIAFDTAVNCGVARTKKWLAKNNNSIALLFRRLDHYVQLCLLNPKQKKFMLGWTNRVVGLFNEVTKPC